MANLTANCSECGAHFDVPKSMQGGYANCPDCGRACEVKGGVDGEFALLMGFLLFVVIGIAGAVFASAGLAPAIVALVIGLVIYGAIMLCL